MTGKTEYFLSEDGLKLFSRWYMPDRAPSGIILLVHGIGEHSGRYQSWIERFVKIGFALVAFDHRGHGRSEGKRGHIPSLEMVFDDIQLFMERIAEDFPGVPVILYGHSLGGNFVLNYLIHRQPEVKASIVTSPWLTLVNDIPGFLVTIMKYLNKIVPGLVLRSTVKPKNISRNQAVIEAYENDPLTHKKISVRLFCEAYFKGIEAVKNPGKINIPLLLIHAGDDQITDPKSSELFANGNPERIQFKLWPGLYHEIHNEKTKDDVFRYLKEWLELHI